MGGLLGYAWGEDDGDNDDGWDDVEDAIRDLDDDDWDNFVDQIDDDDFDQAVDRLNDRDWDEVRAGRRDVNISDSTIVVGNDLKRNQLDAKLKNKRDAKVNLTGGQRTQVDMQNGVLKREGDTRVAAVGNARRGRAAERPRGLAPANATRSAARHRQAAANRPARDVKLPGAKGRQCGRLDRWPAGRARPRGRASRGRRKGRSAGRRRRRAGRGAEPQAANRAVASGSDRPREAQRASQRGAASKAKAGVKKAGPGPRRRPSAAGPANARRRRRGRSASASPPPTAGATGRWGASRAARARGATPAGASRASPRPAAGAGGGGGGRRWEAR